MIQLRVRTEFSFRQVYGPIPKVVETLAAIGTKSAAIVDPSTWGHVRFMEACNKASIKPMFGTEVKVSTTDGREPIAWAIAEDTRAFYRFSSEVRKEGANVIDLLRNVKGVIRFAGAALTDPDTFDYIDLNPSNPLAFLNSLKLHEATGKPLVVTGDNYYPRIEDYEIFLAMGGRERMTPQHILSSVQLRTALGRLSDKRWKAAIKTGDEIAERAAHKLATAPLIQVKGDFRKMVEDGKRSRLKRGHLTSWPKEYAARLKREIETIEEKKYQSYFLVVADLVQWAKTRMLVGPGRGSSAGSLLCYLAGITEVDPIPHGLLFERFVDLNRSDLPDIDIDFSDVKRDEVFEYLATKYGAENVSRIGNISTLQAKSVLAQVCKRLGIPDYERFNLLNVLVEHSSGYERYGKGIEDTFLNTDIGKSFIRRYPAAALATALENHANHTSVHAAGVIVSMEPVIEFCTVGPDGVAHIDKPDAEKLNLLKIDALGLRTLGIIEDAGVVTNEELYALKLDDPGVLDIFNRGRFAAVFQFEGAAVRQISAQVKVTDFSTIDNLIALARPGPLGGGAADHYIKRKAGTEAITTRHPLMTEILDETYGVVLYQEQVMRIVRELGGFSWEDTSTIRKAMSGRKGEEYFNKMGELFIKGAKARKIDAETADGIWREICTFGAWGFNKSHSVSYGIISYWTAYLKAYHRLEFAAACLRGAKDDNSVTDTLREMTDEGVDYTAFDIDKSEMDWTVQDGKLLGGFLNLVGIGPAKAQMAIEARAAGRLDREKFGAMEVKFSELYPLKKKYAAIYANPEAFGCAEGSRVLTSNEFPEEGGNVLYIGKLQRKRPSDANEAVRVQKRGGKVYKGNTLFVDFECRDDMGEKILCRVDRQDWEDFGKHANDRLVVGDDLMIRGRRIPGYSMIKVIRIRCLNRPDALEV